MSNHNKATYEFLGYAVRITPVSGEPFNINRENLLHAISNVKRNQLDYATENAYRAHLAMYEDALAFHDGCVYGRG
jgi:hypothetical protein